MFRNFGESKNRFMEIRILRLCQINAKQVTYECS